MSICLKNGKKDIVFKIKLKIRLVKIRRRHDYIRYIMDKDVTTSVYVINNDETPIYIEYSSYYTHDIEG